MSVTGTSTKRAFFGMDSAKTFMGHSIEDGPNGTKIVRGVEVFKAGTFRDSMGEQRTWTKKELRKIVENFNVLRNEGKLIDVPMRRDHSWTIDKVLGYIDEAYVKGDKLLVDYSVADPAELEKLITGKYRRVSSEIGIYTDNSDTPYWPTLMGVAYVDIPAVEGLHGAARPEDIAFFNYSPTEEINVNPENDKGAVRPSAFRIKGQDTTDHAAVQAYITELEARPGPSTFRVNGADVTDAAAVQTHIDVLEAFRKETADSIRTDFVKALVADGKIAATQEATMTELAMTMTPEMFGKFQASYKDAPKLGLLAEHGKSGNGGGNTDPGVEDEIEILRGQIAQFGLVGMTEERIKNTKAYKRLTEIQNKQS